METETWKPMPGFEGHYAVSSHGAVKRTAKGPGTRPGFTPKASPLRNGYSVVRPFVQGKGFTRLVHRLVAEAFLGPAPEGRPLVCHLDGNPRNNHVSNLAWGNASENALDAVFHRAHGIGVAAPR